MVYILKSYNSAETKSERVEQTRTPDTGGRRETKEDTYKLGARINQESEKKEGKKKGWKQRKIKKGRQEDEKTGVQERRKGTKKKRAIRLE